MGGKDYIDDQNLDTSLLIYAMDQSQDASSSSCPSPGDYLEAYRQAEGDIYVVTLSALLSGSHNSAWQAKQMFLEEAPEQAGVQALVIDVILSAHTDGKRDRAEHWVGPHFGGQIAAAVNDDGKAHKNNPLT